MIVFFIVYQECGTRSDAVVNAGPYIINGQIAATGAWPWQAVMYLNSQFRCGGSLITKEWILTAAHCVTK